MKDLIDYLEPQQAQTTGEIIKAYRKSFKLSQSALAEIIGENQANISKLEDGSRSIGAKQAMKFCAVFNINLEDLLYPNGIEKEVEYQRVKEKAKELMKGAG